MTLAQFHCPPPLPPPFLIPGLPPFCLYINSTTSSSSFFFLLSFTCYFEARNSPAAERLRPGQSFPGHQPYLLCSALLEASCALGRRGRARRGCAGRECRCVSTRWWQGGVWKCVCLCVCVWRAEKDKMKGSSSGAEEAWCLPSQLLPVLEGDAAQSAQLWGRVGLEARVTGHITV